MAGPSDPVTFEVVCTGNICRSPFIDAVLTDAFEQIAPGEFTVRSSGTHALLGSAPHPETRARLRRHELSLRGYRATQITSTRLLAADVILVMDKEQRQQVIDEEPGANRRVFLVKEFARLLRALDAEQSWTTRWADPQEVAPRERWQQIAQTIAAARERLRGDDDVLADPYQKGPAAFRAMDVEATAAIETIVDVERTLRAEVPRTHALGPEAPRP